MPPLAAEKTGTHNSGLCNDSCPAFDDCSFARARVGGARARGARVLKGRVVIVIRTTCRQRFGHRDGFGSDDERYCCPLCLIPWSVSVDRSLSGAQVCRVVLRIMEQSRLQSKIGEAAARWRWRRRRRPTCLNSSAVCHVLSSCREERGVVGG